MRSPGSYLSNTLLRQLRLIRVLDRALQEAIPPQARPHCRCAGIHGGNLIVFADSASWATLVRFHQHAILSRLRRLPGAGPESIASGIRVRVRNSPGGVEKPTGKPPLSASAADSLESTARTVSDPELGAALLRLAARARGHASG